MTRLVLFTRFAKAGRAKTRLAKDLGNIKAAQLQRQMTRRLGHQASAAGFEHVEYLWADLPAHMPGKRQAVADLGMRMARGLHGLSPVLLMGTDLPLVTTKDLQILRRGLMSHPFVMAPASDGGYWAIGLRAPSFLPKLTMALTAHLDAPAMIHVLGAHRLFVGPTRDDCDDLSDYLRLNLGAGLRM